MRQRCERDDGGFTLVEMLVVVVIVGVLAAIAIPQITSRREMAYRASVASDLRQVAILLESARTAEGDFPSDVPSGYRPSPDVVVTLERVDDDGFCLEGTHARIVSAVRSYDSTAGGMQAEGVTCASL